MARAFYSLDWRTFEQKSVDARLYMFYKIRHKIVAKEEEAYIQTGTGRREYLYRQIIADNDFTRFPFFPRTVIQWNQLPK